MNCGVAVVALLAGGPAVAVRVAVPRHPVAVVVCRVGTVILRCTGVVGGVAVVAVPAQRGVAARGCAGYGRGAVQPVAVAVGVEIPGQGVGGVVLIGGSVAVVVMPVAPLRGARMAGGAVVVAVRGCGHEARGCSAGPGGDGQVAVAIGIGVCVPGRRVGCIVLVGGAVAVVIVAVAQLTGARVDR